MRNKKKLSYLITKLKLQCNVATKYAQLIVAIRYN